MNLDKIVDLIKENFNLYIPAKYHILFTMAVYTILILIYCIFIWKFYKFLAKRDIIKLNLSQYNKSQHPTWRKFGATMFFFIEYIIIIPFLIFFWFAVLSIFLLVLSKGQTVEKILLISSAIVGATRVSAYISEDLSQELAKIFPFTLLVIFLVDPNFFSFGEILERFFKIPELIQIILIYLIFLLILEVFIRGVFTISQLASNDEDIE